MKNFMIAFRSLFFNSEKAVRENPVNCLKSE